MIIQNKPDYLIFADSAKKGENAEFPDISRGWGITIEQTASKPPMEWMNGAFNRVDKNMLYLLQQGVPEWSEKVTYPVNAIIKYNGVLYTAIVENDNAKPSINTTKWKKTQSETPYASNTQYGIVKLNSATNNSSETEAATPLAVKKTYDLASLIIDTFRPLDEESVIFSPDKMYHAVVRNDGLFGLYNSHTNQLVWSVGRDGGLYDGYVNAEKVRGLNKAISSQLSYNSAVDSKATDQIATPLAVKKAYDLANTASEDIIWLKNVFQYDKTESVMYSPNLKYHVLMNNDGTFGIYDSDYKNVRLAFDKNGSLSVGNVPAENVANLSDYVINMFYKEWTNSGDCGFVKLPGGVIIQFGFVNYIGSTGSNGTVKSFYTTFPHTCLSIVCADSQSGANSSSAQAISSSQFVCWGRNGNRYADTALFYIAIGI